MQAVSLIGVNESHGANNCANWICADLYITRQSRLDRRIRVNLTSEMTESASARRYRFGAFEADPSTGELRRQGIRIKLNAQPFQVLLMLLEHPGEVLTREEIASTLWSDGTFVDYDHGVNSAVN